MNGIQKTVHIGLMNLASNLKNGKYGIDDEAFAVDDEDSSKCLAQLFLNDIHDEVLDKMS